MGACMWTSAIRQSGGKERERGPTGKRGKTKMTRGWLGEHERREFGNRDVMLQQILCVHTRTEPESHNDSSTHSYVRLRTCAHACLGGGKVIALTLDCTETWAKWGWGARAQIRRVPPLLQSWRCLHCNLVDEICNTHTNTQYTADVRPPGRQTKTWMYKHVWVSSLYFTFIYSRTASLPFASLFLWISWQWKFSVMLMFTFWQQVCFFT